MKSLEDIIAMVPSTDPKKKSWINDSWQAVVRERTFQGEHKGWKVEKASDPKVSIILKIWDDVDMTPFKGKLVEFSGEGMTRSAYKPEKSPKAIEQISINGKTTIKIVGEAAGGGPIKPAASPARQEESVQRDESTVAERVALYFHIMETVWNDYRARIAEPSIPELSVSDLKDITTHISMTYKEKYGVYAPPIFSREAWKDFVSPSSGKKLGELSEDELKQAVIWSFSHNPEAEAAKAFKEHCLMAAKSKGWTALGLAKEWATEAGLGVSFEEQDLDECLTMAFQCKWVDLTEDLAGQFLKMRNEALREVQQFFRSRTTEPSKGPASYKEGMEGDDIPF